MATHISYIHTTHEPLPLVIGAYAQNSKCSMGGKIRKKQKNSQCTLIIPTNHNFGIIPHYFICVLLRKRLKKNVDSVSTAKRKLERRQFSTSSSFVKI